MRIWKSLENTAVQCRFHDLGIPIKAIVAEEQKFLASSIPERQTMSKRILRTPGIQEFPAFIIDENIVTRFVGDHDQTPSRILNHFVAIFHRSLSGIERPPVFLDAVPKIAVADYFLSQSWRTYDIYHRSRKEAGCACCDGSAFQEVSPRQVRALLFHKNALINGSHSWDARPGFRMEEE